MVPLVVITKYFKKKRILATGVSSAGFSFGSVTCGLSLGYIIDLVGWRFTLAILAMLNIQSVVFIALLFDQIKPRAEVTTVEVILNEANEKFEVEVAKPKKSKCLAILSKLNFMDFSLLKNRSFSILVCATLPTMCGTMSFYALGPNRAFVQGVPKVYSSFISAAVGSCSFMGRIIAGIIGNRHVVNSAHHYSICVLIGAAMIALSTLAGPSLPLHLLFCALFGIFMGKFFNYLGIY